MEWEADNRSQFNSRCVNIRVNSWRLFRGSVFRFDGWLNWWETETIHETRATNLAN
jgi:hypothetical protein